MADVPVRFAGLRGTLAAFAVDLFAGRVGSLTDAPMCSGGSDRWGVYDGSAWRLGPASDYAGNANVLSLLVNGTSVIDSSRNVKGASLWSGGAIRIDALGDGFLRNLSISGLTNGTIPLVSTAGGLLGNSALSEGASAITSTKALVVPSIARADGAKYQAKLGASTIALATVPGSWYTVATCAGSGSGMARITVIDDDATLGRSVLDFLVPMGLYDDPSALTMLNSWLIPKAWDAARLVVNGTTAMFQLRAKYASTSGRSYIASASDIVTSVGSSTVTAVAFVIDNGTNTLRKEISLEDAVSRATYIKTTDTTIGPSATTKASLLNGGVLAGGFAAVTDPAGRWNQPKAKNRVELAGVISSAANQAITFELYRNGVVSATLTIPTRTYGTNTPWRLVIKQTVRVNGTSGQVRVLMRFYCTADNTNSAASCYQMDATLTGVNLTASHTWDVVCTIPNNASNQITCQDAEKVG